MAGMLAARVLADHFEQVTILERDHFSETEEPRKGLPQAPHLHGLLARGLKIVEELFPGIRQELASGGAIELDAGSDIAWLTPAGWGKPIKSPYHFLSCSRAFLDRHVRRRMAVIKNVAVVSGCQVNALLTDEKRDQVTGVTVKLDDRADTETIEADLVVDASGRHSHAPEWLTSLGCEPVRETVVNAFLGYATRLYELPAMIADGVKGVLIQAAPPEAPRSGIAFPIENDRLILTLSGGGRDYPPSDERGFLEFTESLRSPHILYLIQNAKPLSEIRTFRNTQNRLRHYEELSNAPGGFVLLGDSVCAFNPVYGQGMTTAAIGAMELGNQVNSMKSRSFDGAFVRSFQKRLAATNTLPWSLATGSDCRYPETEGASRNLKSRLMHGYINRIIELTTRDAAVRWLWLAIFQMVEPPSKLFKPTIVLKVLRSLIARPERAAAPPRFAVAQPTWASTSRDS